MYETASIQNSTVTVLWWGQLSREFAFVVHFFCKAYGL